ncbi:dihydropteroate synthase [Candidatus Kaiserbacteria bacterium RIFCSPHIGHO2_02_FULL_49_16]|uniref:Dihydropteroate synthase n=1 Tax=Candidatus Kaiserbacteria bacterium RIFCSPHIGHO2_02_FULL_49_16 TaxID=1798490 RepID=A0A1F6DHJ4_9BACT|nr:MAG: dihydropteroate synthase [Candidatus Kaiserbacteria bacterium RIFCSPHIGHO2_02_FULL_49_16]
MTVDKSKFEWGKRTYIMGIINTTLDSFSGDGLMAQGSDWVAAAVAHGVRQEKDGANILDVGGESTRPGSDLVSLDEELNRVIPVIEGLVREVSIPISIDTYKSEVARQAIRAGASMVNDVWALKMDSEMAGAVAEHKVPIILMHNRSTPKNAEMKKGLGSRYIGVEYKDLMQDIKNELEESIDMALKAGVKREHIIVDPGIGFGKTVEQNLELIYHLNELKTLGLPILAGPSRKSFIGYTLDLPPEERLEGTAAAVTLCIERGADIIRVHDVLSMRRVAKLTDAIVRRQS